MIDLERGVEGLLFDFERDPGIGFSMCWFLAEMDRLGLEEDCG